MQDEALAAESVRWSKVRKRETFSNSKHVSSGLKELKTKDCFTVELSIKQLKKKEEVHCDCLRQWALQGNKESSRKRVPPYYDFRWRCG